MSIQHTTAVDAALARKRAAFVAKHRLRDYRLSGHNLLRMVRAAGADKDAVDAIRKRFTSYGWLQWPNSSWDHVEHFGRDRMPLVFVSHPYSINDEGLADMELFRSAGLHVVVGEKRDSWYGYGTHHIRIEHPAFSGKLLPPPATKPSAKPPAKPVEHTRPAPSDVPPLAAIEHEWRLRRHAPQLLTIAKAFAMQLTEALALIPHTPSVAGVTCVHCSMKDDLDRILSVVGAIDGVDAAFVTEEGPLFDPSGP